MSQLCLLLSLNGSEKRGTTQRMNPVYDRNKIMTGDQSLFTQKNKPFDRENVSVREEERTLYFLFN